MTLAVVAAALVAGAVAVAAQQQPLFRSGTELVDLYVTVTDRSGRLVPDLTRDDFVVFDNGRPQELILFENEVRPITVVVMLDTSASVTPSLRLLKAGAEQFLIRMLPDDRGRVGAFNDKIQVEPAEFTGDRDRLIDALDVLDFGNPTRLYDGVAAGLDALTDVDRAVAEEVMIYSIGLEADYFNGVRRVRTRPDRNLRRFAEETGGGYFELQETSDLGPTFTRVAQELHSQYVLGFAPQVRDGRVHELEVRLKPRGMRARARRSYVAPADTPPAARR